MGNLNSTTLSHQMKFVSLALLCLFALAAYSQAQMVQRSCPSGTVADFKKSYKRCCHYANRRLQQVARKLRVRVKVCRRKKMFCRYGEHTNRARGYARCCRYVARRAKQVAKPAARKLRVRICKRKKMFCRFGWKTNWARGYARCCKRVARRAQAVQPRVRVRVCQRA